MELFLSVVNKVYELSSFPERIATIFWVLFVFLYVILNKYEVHHNLMPNRKRKTFNFHGTLFVAGLPPAFLHYASRHMGWTFYRSMVSEQAFGHLFTTGFIFLCLGLYFVYAGRIAMDGYWGVHIYEYDEDPATGTKGKLITSGVYKHCRHPVYLGQVLMTIGTMMLSNNWWFCIFPIVTAGMSFGRALNEHKDLKERFGKEYEEYRKNTPVFIPFVF